MNKLIFALLLLCQCIAYLEGASILALFSSLSYTDHLVFRGYLSLLLQRGHSLAVMTAFPGHFTSEEMERIVELDVSQESMPYWNDWKNHITNTDDLHPSMSALNELKVKLAIAQLKSKQMNALLINPEIKFDLVITEADVPILYAAADKYKAPHISITTSSGAFHQHEAKGNPTHPLLYPDVYTLNYGKLSLWQSFIELKRHWQSRREYFGNYLPLCQIAAEKIFGLQRSLLEVEEDIDVLLVAANPVLSGNRASVPAVAYADGLHIQTDVGLEEDVQTILDSSKKGVVYFSLGAMQESESLSVTLLQTLTEAFRELPFTVLWKIGNTTMIKKPDNVLAKGWFQQQAVLAHRNVKAFITHGGARSLEEAVFYGVPIIGLPLLRTRKAFLQEVTKHGAGEILDPYYLTKDALKSNVITVANNDTYKKSILELKQKAFDPLISGPERAIWWTEYVIYNHGASHLKSPMVAVGLSYFQYLMLEVIMYLAMFAVVVLFSLYFVLRLVVRRFRKRFLGGKGLGGKIKDL